MHAIGFGSLNLDEFWEVPQGFLRAHGLRVGEEYVRDIDWFRRIYPILSDQGSLKAADPGGSAANMIAAMRKMGFKTGFYGATGREDAQLLRLNELGNSKNLMILQTHLPSGRCLALIDKDDPGKDRALVILPNANDLAGSQGLDLKYFEASGWVHMTSFVSDDPLQMQIKLAHKLAGGTRLSFDPGPIYCERGLDVLKPLLLRTQILFITEQELERLTGDAMTETAVDSLLSLGIDTVVVKLGVRGAHAFTGSKAIHRPAFEPSRILDRTGAGDVLAAGFLAGTIKCLGTEASLELAVRAAAKSIEGYGRKEYPDTTILEG